jgi:hypothetical protein
VNTGGLAILEECDKYGLCILNGTSFETSSPGRYTSHQPRGQSTIDYGFVSEGLLPLVKSFHVECPTANQKDDWADHTRICVTLDGSAISQSRSSNFSQHHALDFSGNEEIDLLSQATMAARETPEKALSSLYGPVR